MANLTQYLKQINKDLKMKAGGAIEAATAPMMHSGPGLATGGQAAVMRGVDAAGPALQAAAKPAIVGAATGVAGLGAGAALGAGAGAAGAQADMAAQLDAEQQQKFAMAAQEMGKMAVYDPATGTASITPQAIKKSLEKINGQGSAEGLTAQDYQEIAAMTGLQLDMSGVA